MTDQKEKNLDKNTPKQDSQVGEDPDVNSDFFPDVPQKGSALVGESVLSSSAAPNVQSPNAIMQEIMNEIKNIREYSYSVNCNDQMSITYFNEKIPKIISMILNASMSAYPLEDLKKLFIFIVHYIQIRINYLDTMPMNEVLWIFRILDPNSPFYFNSLPQIKLEAFEELMRDVFPAVDGQILKTEYRLLWNTNYFYRYLLTYLQYTNFYKNVLNFLNSPLMDHDKFIYIVNTLTRLISFYPTFDIPYILDFAKTNVIHWDRLFQTQQIKDINKVQLEFFFRCNIYTDIAIIQKVYDMEDIEHNELIRELLRKELKVAYFLTSSQNLEKRVLGMKAMNDLCMWLLSAEKMEGVLCNGFPQLIKTKRSVMLEWLERINIFQIIFGENIHEALLKKSSLILIFLYMNNKLSFDQIDFIWKFSQDKHEAISGSIFNIFSDLISSFSIEHAMNILKVINEMPFKDVTDITIKILDSFSNNKYLVAASQSQGKNEANTAETMKVEMQQGGQNMNMTDNNNLNLLNDKSSENEKNLGFLITDKLNALDSKDFHDFKAFYLKILWKFSSESSYYAGMLPHNINRARKVLAPILLKPVFKFELAKYVKKSIYGIGCNHMLSTHLSLLELIIKNMKSMTPETLVESLSVFGPEIKDTTSFLTYLEKQFTLKSTILSAILDVKKEVMIFAGEIINIQSSTLVNDQSLSVHEILNNYEMRYEESSQMFFKNIQSDHIQGNSNSNNINANIPISHNPLLIEEDHEPDLAEGSPQNNVGQNMNNLDVTQSTEKSLDDSLSSISTDISTIEKTRMQIVRDFIEGSVNQITNSSFSLQENYEYIFKKLKLNFMNQNYYSIVTSLMEFLKNLIFTSTIQLTQSEIEYLFTILVENAVDEEEMGVFFLFFAEIFKVQYLSNSVYISEDNMNYILFDLVLKLDLCTLQYSGFCLFKQIFFLINSAHNNLILNGGKIADVKDFTQLVGFESLWKCYLETKVQNVSNDSQAMLVSLIATLSKREDNKDSFLFIFDKIFANLNLCYQSLINERVLIFQIDDVRDTTLANEERAKKLINLLFVANSTRQKFDKPKEAEMITLKIRNNYFNNDEKPVPLQISSSATIKELQNLIIDKIIFVGDKEGYRAMLDDEGIFLNNKGRMLREKMTIRDYKIENDSLIQVFRANAGFGDIEIDEKTLYEGVQQLKMIFEYDDEVLKRGLKKCNGNLEDATLYFTDEAHVTAIMQDIQEEAGVAVVSDIQTKLNLELFNDDKITLLIRLLDLEILPLSTAIWQLLSAIKYPSSLISFLVEPNILNFKEIFDTSKPNRLLLYLKLLHSLVFGDKFFINVSKLEESKMNEWKISMVNSEGILILLQTIEKIIHIIEVDTNSYCIKLTGIQCLQFLSKWLHFFIFATGVSLSYNREGLSSILKQVIMRRPPGIQFGVPKDKEVSTPSSTPSQATPTFGSPHSSFIAEKDKEKEKVKSHKQAISITGAEEYENYFEEEVSNIFYLRISSSNLHLMIMKFIHSTTSQGFMQMNINHETESIYLNFLEVLIIFNELNSEAFKETVQWEYDNSVIINLLFVERSKCVRKLVENFFILLSQYSKSIELSQGKNEIQSMTKPVREIVSIHILNNYKRIYSCQVYEEFFNLFGHILLHEKELSSESFVDFNVSDLSNHIMGIIYKHACKNDIDLSEIEQEQLSGNIHLFQCLCANHESIILTTLERFTRETGINIIDFIYNCLFTIQDDIQDTSLKNYERIKFRFSNKNLRQKTYTLLNYLIRVKESFKTDLTMNLLSHHKNLRSEASKTIDLDIPFRMKQDKFIGLTNYGCTCYLNSLLQQLYMMPHFRECLYSISVLDNYPSVFPELVYNPLFQLQLVFANLSSTLRKYHPPLHFIQSFTHAFNDQPISLTTQQDSDEFLNILTDKIEKVANTVNRENFLEDSIKGKISNEIISLEKDYPYYSESQESCMRITLDIKNKRTIEEALDLFVKEEILEGENKYYCEKFDRKIAIMKRYSIKKLSKNVIIHLKRFEFDYNIFDNVKLNDYIEFPHLIDFKNWMRASILVQNKDDPKFKDVVIDEETLNELNDPDAFKYVLTGILVHSGSTIQHGHYFSFIMDQDTGKWYRFDDKHVSEFNVNDIKVECFGDDKDSSSALSKSQNAYLLFYTKKDSMSHIANISVPLNLLGQINKENIQFLKYKTYIDQDYYQFIKDFVDYNILKNKTLDKLTRKEQSMTRRQLNEEEISSMALEICSKSQINPNDGSYYANLKEIYSKCREEVNGRKVITNTKQESSLKKKLIKFALYYYLEIIINQNEKNKITKFAIFLSDLLETDRTSACWVLKTFEKNPEVFMEHILTNSVTEVREGFNRVILNSIFAVQQDEWKYLKETFTLLYFVEKNEANPTDQCFKLVYPKSCVMRFLKQNIFDQLDFIRPHWNKFSQFLGIIQECFNSIYETVELGYVCNMYHKVCLFIMNNQGAFKTSFPTMGGKGNEPNFAQMVDILCTMVLSAVTRGIMNLNKYSSYSRLPQQINQEAIHLPNNWEILLDKSALVGSILRKYSSESTRKLCHHLCWGDLETSMKIIAGVHMVFRDNFKDIPSLSNLLHNSEGILEVDDMFKTERTGAFFLLDDRGDQHFASLFDFLFSLRDDIPFNTLICLKLVANIVMKFTHVYDFLLLHIEKLKWIYDYLKAIEGDSKRKEALSIEAASINCNLSEVISRNYEVVIIFLILHKYCLNLKLADMIEPSPELEKNSKHLK